MRSSSFPCLLTAETHEVGSTGLSSSRWTDGDTASAASCQISWLLTLALQLLHGNGGWLGLRKDDEEGKEGRPFKTS